MTVLYLCVLGLCFVVPIFYYFRMHCEERTARRMRELEIAALEQSLEQSENVHREESRAARRKYREERRARIIQLFAPVRMVRKQYSLVEKEYSDRGGLPEPNPLHFLISLFFLF